MGKTVRRFGSHREADAADRVYYQRLTAAQRLDILLDLITSHRDSSDETAEGFARVYRIVELRRR
jgi:hypothetical protein